MQSWLDRSHRERWRSSVRNPFAGQDVGEGLPGLGEALRAGVHALRADLPQVRLQGEEAIETVGAQRADRLDDLTVARASNHDRPVRQQRVFDLDVADMWAQHVISLGERPHSNLNEVGRIPSES